MYLKTKEAASKAGFKNSAGLLMTLNRHPEYFPNLRKEGKRWYWHVDDIDAFLKLDRKKGWPAGKKRLVSQPE